MPPHGKDVIKLPIPSSPLRDPVILGDGQNTFDPNGNNSNDGSSLNFPFLEMEEDSYKTTEINSNLSVGLHSGISAIRSSNDISSPRLYRASRFEYQNPSLSPLKCISNYDSDSFSAGADTTADTSNQSSTIAVLEAIVSDDEDNEKSHASPLQSLILYDVCLSDDTVPTELNTPLSERVSNFCNSFNHGEPARNTLHLNLSSRNKKTALLSCSTNTCYTPTKRKLNPNNKTNNVSFTFLKIRTYNQILGDHPCCQSGPPLSLGWEYTPSVEVPIEDFEAKREKRRTRKELRLSCQARRDILSSGENCRGGGPGYSLVEIKRAERRMFRQREGLAHGASVKNMFFGTFE